MYILNIRVIYDSTSVELYNQKKFQDQKNNKNKLEIIVEF